MEKLLAATLIFWLVGKMIISRLDNPPPTLRDEYANIHPPKPNLLPSRTSHQSSDEEESIHPIPANADPHRNQKLASERTHRFLKFARYGFFLKWMWKMIERVNLDHLPFLGWNTEELGCELDPRLKLHDTNGRLDKPRLKAGGCPT